MLTGYFASRCAVLRQSMLAAKTGPALNKIARLSRHPTVATAVATVACGSW